MRPLVWLSKIPGALPRMRRIYRRIAEKRHCAAVCSADAPSRHAQLPRGLFRTIVKEQ